MRNSEVREELLAAIGNAVSETLPGAIADEIDELAGKRLADEAPLDAAVLSLVSSFVRDNGKEGIDDMVEWLDDTLSGKSKPPPADLPAEQLTKIATLMQDAEAQQIRTAKRWARHTAVLLRQAMRFAAFALSA